MSKEFHTVLAEGPYPMRNGDTILIPNGGDILHKCCGCGLWHHMELTHVDGNIEVIVSELPEGIDLSEVDCETGIKEAE